MANEEQLAILRQGAKAWNAWRAEHYDLHVNLSEMDLRKMDLSGMDLSRAELSGARLNKANLRGANLNRANLKFASLETLYVNLSEQVKPHALGMGIARAVAFCKQTHQGSPVRLARREGVPHRRHGCDEHPCETPDGRQYESKS